METTIGLYGKGNEMIFWRSLYVGLCLVLSDNCQCMHFCCWSTLHQIYTNQINNDIIYKGTKTISSDDNVHSSLCVAREKVKNLFLYVNFTFRCDNYNCISKHTSTTVGSLSHEQCSKWVPKSSMVWPHWHCERCETIRCDIMKRIWSVIRKWVEDKQNQRVLTQANNQAPVVGPTHEQNCVRTTSKKTAARSEVNSCLCRWSINLKLHLRIGLHH
jgi:hypothetical protein